MSSAVLGMQEHGLCSELCASCDGGWHCCTLAQAVRIDLQPVLSGVSVLESICDKSGAATGV